MEIRQAPEHEVDGETHGNDDDDQKADKCGDTVCYHAKLRAHADRAISAALEKNPDAKKGFISKFLTSEAQGELANEADEIQEHAWGRSLHVCKKKDDGAVKYVLIYPLEKAGQIVYASKGGQKPKGDAGSDGKTETGRLKGPEMLKRRRLAWMLKSLAESLPKSNGLSKAYDSDAEVLELVAKYGSPHEWERGNKKEPVRLRVFRSMAGGIASEELRFNLVSDIDPKQAEKAMKLVLSYVDDSFEDGYDKLAAAAAEEIGTKRKAKAKDDDEQDDAEETDIEEEGEE